MASVILGREGSFTIDFLSGTEPMSTPTVTLKSQPKTQTAHFFRQGDVVKEAASGRLGVIDETCVRFFEANIWGDTTRPVNSVVRYELVRAACGSDSGKRMETEGETDLDELVGGDMFLITQWDGSRSNRFVGKIGVVVCGSAEEAVIAGEYGTWDLDGQKGTKLNAGDTIVL